MRLLQRCLQGFPYIPSCDSCEDSSKYFSKDFYKNCSYDITRDYSKDSLINTLRISTYNSTRIFLWILEGGSQAFSVEFSSVEFQDDFQQKLPEESQHDLLVECGFFQKILNKSQQDYYFRTSKNSLKNHSMISNKKYWEYYDKNL